MAKSKTKPRARRPAGSSRAPAGATARTAGQRAALAELRQLAKTYPAIVLRVEILAEAVATARVRVSTADIGGVPTGLPISADYEDVLIHVPANYPDTAPAVSVEHDRFVDHTHVLKGHGLCIYLDPAREWSPTFGMERVLVRLRAWFADAAHDRFDSRTALYHVFGGVPPRTAGVVGPTVVLRSSPPVDGKPISLATLRRRTPSRLAVVGWRQGRATPPERNAVVLAVPRTLPYGLADTLGLVLAQVAAAGGAPTDAAAAAIVRAATHSVDGSPLYVFLAAAHPAAPSVVHFACGHIPPFAAAALRTGKARHDSDMVHLPIEWLPMSDERPEITTRRDSTRPVAALYGKTVEVWGCGGLGSWLAEYVVRAGAAAVVLRDHSPVHGGILSRQNYREEDIGRPKASQLAKRLRAIADGVDVDAEPGSVLDLLRDGGLPDCDVIIDATINESVAVRLDQAAQAATTRPLLAQVATDPRTASLGLIVVAGPHAGVGSWTIDNAAAELVLADGTLERFHGFWSKVSKTDQLVPAAGCSVPTFHGSAADLAVMAGSMATLVGQHTASGTSGTHLIAAPVSAPGVTHRFLPYPAVPGA